LVFVRPRLRFNLLPPPPKDKAEEEAAEKENKAKKVRDAGGRVMSEEGRLIIYQNLPTPPRSSHPFHTEFVP